MNITSNYKFKPFNCEISANNQQLQKPSYQNSYKNISFQQIYVRQSIYNNVYRKISPISIYEIEPVSENLTRLWVSMTEYYPLKFNISTVESMLQSKKEYKINTFMQRSF